MKRGSNGELGSISGVTDARKKTLRCPDVWAHAVSGWVLTPSGFLPGRAVGLF
jgi:hypothetical protein